MSDHDKIKKSRRRSLRTLKNLLHASESPKDSVILDQFDEEYGSVWLPESGRESHLTLSCMFASSASVDAGSSYATDSSAAMAALSQPLKASPPGPHTATTSLLGTPELFRCAQDEQTAFLTTPVGFHSDIDFVAHHCFQAKQASNTEAVYQAPKLFSLNKGALQQKNVGLPLVLPEGNGTSPVLEADRVSVTGMHKSSCTGWNIPRMSFSADYNSPSTEQSKDSPCIKRNIDNLVSTCECDAEYCSHAAGATVSLPGCFSTSCSDLLNNGKPASGLQSSFYTSQVPGSKYSTGCKSVADAEHTGKENQANSPVSATDTWKCNDDGPVAYIQSADLDTEKIGETFNCRLHSSVQLSSDNPQHVTCVNTRTDFNCNSMSTLLTSNDSEVTSSDTEVQQYLQSDFVLPSPAEDKAAKQIKKAKKERRRSFFNLSQEEESCADYGCRSLYADDVCTALGNSANACKTDSEYQDHSGSAGTGREPGLPPHSSHEENSAVVSSVEAKGSKRKRRSVNVALIEENAHAEEQPLGHQCSVTREIPRATASGTMCRRSSLRLYRWPSYKSGPFDADTTLVSSVSQCDIESKTGKAEFTNEADAGVFSETVHSTISQEILASTPFENAASKSCLPDNVDPEKTEILPEVENLYRNQQYKKPQDRTWETIFESPSRGKLVSKQKLRRYLQFDKIPISKQKRRQKRAALNGWHGNRLSKIDNHDLLLKLESLQDVQD